MAYPVHTWQRFYNMEPRDDSRLTQLFADGATSMAADEVARELMATEFLYRYTLYGDVIEDFMRDFADRVRAEWPRLTWTQVWDITRFYAPPALKLLCLLTSRQYIPNRLP